MKKKLSAKYRSGVVRITNGAMRKAEDGMATAEWAMVTLAAVALALVLLTAISELGPGLLKGILSKAFSH